MDSERSKKICTQRDKRNSNCFNGGRSRGCSSLSANEIREAIRTAEAAACAAARSAKEAEAAACNAERFVKGADQAVCAAQKAAQEAAQCAKAAEAAKDRMIYMLEQMNGGNCEPEPLCHHEPDCRPEPDCDCDYRY